MSCLRVSYLQLISQRRICGYFSNSPFAVTSKLVWFSLVMFETSENESSLLYSVVTYNTVLLFLIFMFVFK